MIVSAIPIVSTSMIDVSVVVGAAFAVGVNACVCVDVLFMFSPEKVKGDEKGGWLREAAPIHPPTHYSLFNPPPRFAIVYSNSST